MKNTNKPNRILVVDDHPAIRATMNEILIDEGFQTEVAENGKEALELCLSQEFNFVLMDIQMPEMNGVEVFKKLKEKNKRLPKFIFFSAYSTPELQEQAVSLGAYAFLTKPIRVEKILELLRLKRAISILVHFADDHMRNCISSLLTENGYTVNKAVSHDDALIQLRQINYNAIVFDTDSPSLEQEAIKNTIRSAKTKTICVETNEDESPREVLKSLSYFLDTESQIFN